MALLSDDFGSGVPGVADPMLKPLTPEGETPMARPNFGDDISPIPVVSPGPEKPLEHTKINADQKVPVARGVFMRFPLAIEAIAKVSKFGSIKYNSPLESLGYLKVPDAFLTYTDALSRHLLKERTEGPINDQDGGVLHAAQVAWCALARLEAYLRSDSSVAEPHYENRNPKEPGK